MVNSKKSISRLHYLTQDLADVSHQELAEVACANGIRWIQLRVKNKPYDEWLQIAREVKFICERSGATLIINDNVQIAKEVDAQGVHLGKSDMPLMEARKILGEDKIIGGTANTLEDVLRLQSEGADYIGLGPFRFTATKENLSSILGMEGYSSIVQCYNSSIPIIAIGGITMDDVRPLLDAGVYGVAVSSAINAAADKAKTIREFLKAV